MMSKKPSFPFLPRLLTAGLCAAVIVLFTSVLRSAAPAQPAGLALFNSDIRPILVDHCVKCHGGEKTKGEFDLTTREGLLHPGAEGVNVVPGDAESSRLMKLVRHEDDPAMPAKADKLPDEAIATLAAWIDAGAVYEKPLVEKGGTKRPRSLVTDADRQFWSFRPLP